MTLLSARIPLPAGLIIIVMVSITGCDREIRSPFEQDIAAGQVWPAPPAAARLGHLMSIYGPADLGISSNLILQLSELISGPSQIRLIRPMAVVQVPDGGLYVADPGARGIHYFDMAGRRYSLIQGENNQPLPSPVGMAASVDGTVYISDSRLAAVYKIAPGTNIAVKLPLRALLGRPTGLALDLSGERIYLVDTANHEVKVFSRDGELLNRIGGRGTRAGEFNFPTMIWRDSQGQLLIADSLNFRIQIFDHAGNYLRQFGDVGEGPGYLAQPRGVASDRSGHIYVVDSVMHAVQIFDMQGEFLFKLGMRGNIAGEFWLPAGIFIGAEDRIYIADSYNGRVQVFQYLGAETR